jgi:hypothetical protein
VPYSGAPISLLRAVSKANLSDYAVVSNHHGFENRIFCFGYGVAAQRRYSLFVFNKLPEKVLLISLIAIIVNSESVAVRSVHTLYIRVVPRRANCASWN